MLTKIAADTGKGIEPILRDSILPIVTCAIVSSSPSHIESSPGGLQQNEALHDFAQRSVHHPTFVSLDLTYSV